MATSAPLTDRILLDRVIGPDTGNLTVDAARALLKLRFPSEDTKTIRKLLRKNNKGGISAEERLALEKYLRMGQFLDLLHAKARVSLAKHARTN